MMINCAIGSYVLSLLSVLMGLNKMFIYKNGSAIENSVNAYVGSDASNYIINASYATAWFVLSVLFVIVGFTFVFVHYQNLKQNTF